MSRNSIDARTRVVNGNETPRASFDKPKGNDSAVLDGNGASGSTLEQVQAELERTKLEKETLEGQYRTLLDRLSDMKSKIGTKLQQDAEELERRETLISTLTAQNEDLQNTIASLHSELTSSNAESERVTKELDALRNTLQQTQQASSRAHSTELSALTSEAQSLRDQVKESQELLERARLEKEEWERVLVDERVLCERLRGDNYILKRDAENERVARQRFEAERDEERKRADNLEAVLSEFEAGQERAISELKATYTAQIDSLTQSLAEYKSRALNAEVELDSNQTSSSRVAELEKELKEKSMLLNKVRQEAVTLNEHLIQALRRLRKFSADPTSTGAGSNGANVGPSYVDRRLVTNVLLQFITAPRADAKRFEMLNLLGGILGWNDDERRQAGLQRGSSSSSGTNTPKVKPKNNVEEEKAEDSFSKMWVEFLLKESSQGASSSTSPAGHGHSPSTAYTPSNYAPSSYAKSAYAPSNAPKSTYAASSIGAPSPTESTYNLPPLPSLPGAGGRSTSGAYRLPSLSRGFSGKSDGNP